MAVGRKEDYMKQLLLNNPLVVGMPVAGAALEIAAYYWTTYAVPVFPEAIAQQVTLIAAAAFLAVMGKVMAAFTQPKYGG